MESLNKTWSQITGLFASLSPSQRLSLLVAPAVVLAGFAYLLVNGSSSTPMTPLVGGKALTPGEVETAVSVLHGRGLTDYERAGNQILVPADKVTEYHGALLAGGGLPNGWGEMFEKEMDGSSVFTSRERLQTMREIALAKFIREWLRTVPDIIDGNVVWARSDKRNRFSRNAPTVTATVTLRPRPGTEVSRALAESVAQMIANAIPDLKREQVLVFSSNGKAFSAADDDDPFGGKMIQRMREFTEEYTNKVESALSYIPGVRVTVHVDLDNVASALEEGTKVNSKDSAPLVTRTEDRTTTIATQQPRAEPGAVSNTPRSLDSGSAPTRNEQKQDKREEIVQQPSLEHYRRQLVGAMPTGVRVAIGIPEDYYESAVVQKGVERGEDEAAQQAFDAAVEEFRKEVATNVTATVGNAIGTPPEKISVTSYVGVDAPQPDFSLPLTDRVGDWVRQWGGTLGLAAFAVIALMMMRRTAPATAAPEDEEDDPVTMPNAPVPAMPEVEAEPDAEQMARDELQESIRDNPEMAAAVIGKWIRATK